MLKYNQECTPKKLIIRRRQPMDTLSETISRSIIHSKPAIIIANKSTCLTISLKNHHGRLISYVGEVFICQVLDTHLGRGAKDGQND
jgi:hypothetical protein